MAVGFLVGNGERAGGAGFRFAGGDLHPAAAFTLVHSDRFLAGGGDDLHGHVGGAVLILRPFEIDIVGAVGGEVGGVGDGFGAFVRVAVVEVGAGGGGD